MKATAALFLVLIGGCLSAETITIGISLRGGQESIDWTIEKGDDGVVTSAVKTQRSDSSALERLVISKSDSTVNSEYSNNQYHYTQRIRWTGDGLEVQYSTKNDFLKENAEGERSLRPTVSGFVDTINGRVVRRVDLSKGQILDAAGLVLMRRDGDVIYNYELGTRIIISQKGGISELLEQSNTPVVPPTRMTVRGTLGSTSPSVTMLNYCLLPNDLLFLLLMP